ncbi:hypothetical protein QFZ23_000701 [Arthrobacter globiformis]|uniref:PIG-L family deacetylase n=1 Tax=Arthrobacter globiformis TaxID=1665 RepID=UPI0027851669|nr:PIG-L family deacetylase [Arthrobacter globiformis]MDQ1056800.1 hypothetical protein [Arthrobacter globiformis]
MVTFSHADAGADEAAWAAGGLGAVGELRVESAGLARMEFVVLVAHPDDESLGAGGLLARLTSAGAHVEVGDRALVEQLRRKGFAVTATDSTRPSRY